MPAKGIHRRIPLQVTDALQTRFWGRVDKGEVGECWNWTGAFRNGYGAVKHNGKVHSAHRVAFILTNGEPSEGHLIAHKCDNRACCNPDHLEAITPGDNVRDAFARGRINVAKGEETPHAVLNEQSVARVWSLKRQGKSGREIAAEIGFSYAAVKNVLSKRSWKHLIPEWAR